MSYPTALPESTDAAMDARHFKRLRIAFVVHDYNRHIGQSRYVVELATRFRRDHEVHIFANTFEGDVAGITCHRIPAWRKNALSSILSFVVPATFLVRGPFDIIHAQGLCGLRHNVATMHMCQPAWYGALATMAGGLTFKQRLSKWLITPLERRALTGSFTRRVITVSERVRDDLERHFGRSQGVQVIYHGVDLERFHPGNKALYRTALRRELGLSDDECVALYVGHLQKGAAAAIRAIAHVPGVRLLLASASDAADYREVAIAERVPDRVIFHSSSKQIHSFFAAADLLVFPTLYDSYGMVISEAMASGIPAVTSRAAGAAELVTHGVNGWLTDGAWAVDEIAVGVRALAEDPSLRARLGAAARATIEEYTWDRTARETMDVYRQVIAQRNS